MAEVVHDRVGVGTKLFGAEKNPYFAQPSQRMVKVELRENDEGDNQVQVFAGREYQPGKLVWDRVLFQSPVMRDPLEINEWCETAWSFATAEMTGQIDGPRPPVPVSWDVSLCPKCDRLNTLKVTQEAYGNRVDCTADGCGYNDWQSIGD